MDLNRENATPSWLSAHLDSGWAAVIGAVVGGLVAGALSYVGIVHQAHADRQNSQEQFVHTQALVAYGAAISASNAAFRTADTYCKDAGRAQLPALLSDADARNSAFVDAASEVAVIGTNEASADLATAEFDLNAWIANCQSGPSNSAIAQHYGEAYAAELQRFAQAARHDVGR